jgi:F-type H+-transporting ATPase subunit a
MGHLIETMPSLLAAEEGGSHGLTFLGLWVYLLFTLAIIFGAMAYAKKDLGSRVFRNPITQAFEQMYLFIENMCVGTIGPHGRKYVPMIVTFWLVIFVGNAVALFFPSSPTADLSFNLAMALISIFYVQWEGIKANGVAGHFSHFAGPKLAVYMIPITIMIFVIEIISELMKNVSLSLRLYGNIHGGHQAVEAMNALGKDIYVPLGAFLLPVKLLTVVVQAMIFTLLTCVYLSLVTGHHDDDHSHGAMSDHAPEPANPGSATH